MPLPLFDDPRAARVNKRLRLTSCAPSRKRDAERPVSENPEYVATGTTMTHKENGSGWDGGGLEEREIELHGELR